MVACIAGVFFGFLNVCLQIFMLPCGGVGAPQGVPFLTLPNLLMKKSKMAATAFKTKINKQLSPSKNTPALRAIGLATRGNRDGPIVPGRDCALCCDTEQ